MSAILHLTGVLGRDSELRYSPQGKGILNFSVATNFGKKNSSGEWENTANWYRVTAFGNLAEKNTLLAKGNKVYVSGQLQISEYQKTDGTKGYSYDVIANQIDWLSPKPKSDTAPADSETIDESQLPF